nr:glyoxysomal fatty acid beta-oxidation multifunctional protein MFP-A-like isoform X1 [Ipomoea batatas]
MEVRDDGVAVITINNPPLNLLSLNVLLSLKRNVEEAVLRDDVKAIVLIGSKGYFSAGFDVTAFGVSQGKKKRKDLGFMSLEFVTDTFEAARKPLVTAVEGLALGGGLEIALEAKALYELRQSNTCRSLVHIFFAQRETSKLPGITNIGLSPRNIGNIAVIGGGLIGSGIATVSVLNNFHVVLKEETEASLQNGIVRVKANLESHVNSGKMTREQFKKTCTLIKGVLSYEGFKDMDLVIEVDFLTVITSTSTLCSESNSGTGKGDTSSWN